MACVGRLAHCVRGGVYRALNGRLVASYAAYMPYLKTIEEKNRTRRFLHFTGKYLNYYKKLGIQQTLYGISRQQYKIGAI